jgi:hypothetical protein
VTRRRLSRLGFADGGQRLVVEVVRPAGVEAEQAEEAGKAPQVDIDDEADIAQRAGTQAVDGPDVQRLEHRVDGDAVADGGAMREADGHTVHEDEVDLGVGNAGRLDDVLHRLVGPERPPHDHSPMLRRHEVVELGIDPNVDMAVADDPGHHAKDASRGAGAAQGGTARLAGCRPTTRSRMPSSRGAAACGRR